MMRRTDRSTKVYEHGINDPANNLTHRFDIMGKDDRHAHLPHVRSPILATV